MAVARFAPSSPPPRDGLNPPGRPPLAGQTHGVPPRRPAETTPRRGIPMTTNLDPTKIHVDVQQERFWEHQESFQDITAEQLRHAPWLGLSIVFHALLALILYMIPSDQNTKKTAASPPRGLGSAGFAKPSHELETRVP